jgi:hypothetical protein
VPDIKIGPSDRELIIKLVRDTTALAIAHFVVVASTNPDITLEQAIAQVQDGVERKTNESWKQPCVRPTV